MKSWLSKDVRQMFIDYFVAKGHRQEPSASLVPQEDPTLLWINSGVATLKKYFDGRIIPDNPKIVLAQKAIRTNDIENVGYTARHHTFFEMLGNFSIGDYFKKEAIAYAWEFLTDKEWIGLEEDRLYVTVHPEDDEAYDIWLHDIGLKKEQIVRLEENFWDIGEGPSGPNTEIFYDRGEKYGNDMNDPELYPGGENERYLEIWNLVFSQFNHNADDTYTPLPNKNIDTGLGLERMVTVLQDVPTNYDTDLFLPIIRKVEEMTDAVYGSSDANNTSFRIIADHLRTVTFAIADHAMPSNEGRGYVLRRLLRRAVRFAKQLDIDAPFMYKLVPAMCEIMEPFYPELAEQEVYIEKVIKQEENRFHETLQDGLKILSDVIAKERKQGKSVFPGEEVFRLYDTYGFPKELTEEYLDEEGFTIDEEGFERAMERQRERARNARVKTTSMQVQDDVFDTLEIDSEFIGYDHSFADTWIAGMLQDSETVEKATEGEEIFLFLRETPFYAESGGQVADTGYIHQDGASGMVRDVQKAPTGEHIHRVYIESGTFHLQDAVRASIDTDARKSTEKNHTATHLLHQALKNNLGSHVNQAGSLVQKDRLRFDFSHFETVGADDLQAIEREINEKIWESIVIETMYRSFEEAKSMGALALFGEKYGDNVRVVAINDYSIELCGGCHVTNTANIGLFKITSETGIGAGTRRIEAVTGKEAYQYMEEQLMLLESAADLLKTTNEYVPERIENIYGDIRTLERENESLAKKLSNQEENELLEKGENIDGIKLLASKVDARDMNHLREMVDDMKQKLQSGVILLAATGEGKVQLAAGVTDDLTGQLHAGDLIKHAAEICDGGGGGRPDMAQAGGKNPQKVDAALSYAEEYIKENAEN